MGIPCGLDWSQVAAVLPSGCDRDRVLALLSDFEGGLIEGAGQTARRQAEEARRRGAG